MGLERNILEAAARRREQSDLGGTITFADGTEVPCSVGMDASGLVRADNSAGVNLNQTRRVLVRTSELAQLAYQPRAGDTVRVQGRLESEPVSLMISPASGIESFNAILTAFNLFNPNA